MNYRYRFYILGLLFLCGTLDHSLIWVVAPQNKPAKSGRPGTSGKSPSPLILKMDGAAREFSGPFETEVAELDRRLKGVLQEMSRTGMDPMELAVSPLNTTSDLSLGLTVRNFIPKSSGPWDKQDVLSFQALGQGPVYLNLSLLQGLLQPMASYRLRVLAKSAQSAFSLDSWKVILERKEGHSLRFEGRFREGQPMIQPSVFLKQKASELEIEADGQDVAEALSRGTFPLPPKILGGQFSSTKALLEFLGKE